MFIYLLIDWKNAGIIAGLNWVIGIRGCKLWCREKKMVSLCHCVRSLDVFG